MEDGTKFVTRSQSIGDISLTQIRKRLTYANVMSSIAVFLVLGGGAAYAAKKISSNEIQSNAITSGKIKKNAVTAAKIKANSITTAKIKKGAVTGAKVNLGTLGTVPNSAKTDVVLASKGTLSVGQTVTVLEHGPIKIVVKCEDIGGTKLSPHLFIESSSDGSMFAGWEDGSKSFGPSTPESEREVSHVNWSDSSGPYAYDAPEPVSAQAADGTSFNAWIGVAAEKDTGTCWYWGNATVIS